MFTNKIVSELKIKEDSFSKTQDLEQEMDVIIPSDLKELIANETPIIFDRKNFKSC